MAFIDLTGQRFGRLTVIERDYAVKPHTRQRTFWTCSCDCGGIVSAESGNLRRGDYQSCGCFQQESIKARMTTHGKTKTQVFKAWQGIRERCSNENNPKFKNYGGRGIKVCDRWSESFENFLSDMGEPEKGQSIDRRNNDGDYCPENCRWADSKTQGRNKRNTSYITLNEEIKPLMEWAEIYNINPEIVRDRLNRGWSDRDALTKPVSANGQSRYILFNGESKTISAWSRITKIDRAVISARLERGWSIEDALTIPAKNMNAKRT